MERNSPEKHRETSPGHDLMSTTSCYLPGRNFPRGRKERDKSSELELELRSFSLIFTEGERVSNVSWNRETSLHFEQLAII